MIAPDDLVDWLGLGVPSTSDLAMVTDLENRAVAFVEQFTDRHFGPTQTFVEIIDAEGKAALWLKEEPGSITQVRERAQPGDTWTAVVAGDFELRDARLIRTGGSVWTAGNEVEVTYDFGYESGQEPGGIRQLVIDLVKLKWDLRTVEQGVESERVGPHAVTYARGEFTADIKQIPWVRETLDAWRWQQVA